MPDMRTNAEKKAAMWRYHANLLADIASRDYDSNYGPDADAVREADQTYAAKVAESIRTGRPVWG